MPSVDDVFNAIQGVNTRLDTVNNQLSDLKNSTDAVKTATDAVKASTDAVKTAVQAVNATLTTGFGQLVTLGVYTNKALFHNSKQNETIICLLEQISDHTCKILNESHIQTGLQTSIEQSATALADLYAATHADAALARAKNEALRKQIEECCPPPEPEPACKEERCPPPPPLEKPPEVEQRDRPKPPR
jgi:chromosome segregation ATPase